MLVILFSAAATADPVVDDGENKTARARDGRRETVARDESVMSGHRKPRPLLVLDEPRAELAPSDKRNEKM